MIFEIMKLYLFISLPYNITLYGRASILLQKITHSLSSRKHLFYHYLETPENFFLKMKAFEKT